EVAVSGQIPAVDGSGVVGARVGADGREVVGAARAVLGRGRAQREHGAAVEVQDGPAVLVGAGDAQRGQAGGGAAGFGRVLAQADHFGAGGQGVAQHREAVEAQAAVEEIGLDVVGGQGRLTDGD